MEILRAFLEALPHAAANELSLLAYLAVVIAWLLLGWRTRRNRNLLNHLDRLPETDRLKALEIEMGAGRLQEGLTAEQWLRGKRDQYRLIAFAVACLAIVVVLVSAGYRAYGEVTASLALYRDFEGRHPLIWPDTRVDYSYGRDGDIIRIQPELGYLESIMSGGFVHGVLDTSDPFRWSFPELSIKLSNNTHETLLVTEVIFDIGHNRVNTEPLPYVPAKSYYGSFSIYNDGWGPVLSPSLLLEIRHPDECDVDDAKLRNDFQVAIGAFEHRYGISIKDRVSAGFRESLEQCTTYEWGEHCELRPVCVLGELEYLTDGGAERLFRFRTNVKLQSPSPEGPRPPSYHYDAYLPAGESDHQIRLPVSQELLPGSTDHFLVTLASDMSTAMEINVSILDSRGRVILEQPLNLEIFVSKAGLKYAHASGEPPPAQHATGTQLSSSDLEKLGNLLGDTINNSALGTSESKQSPREPSR